MLHDDKSDTSEYYTHQESILVDGLLLNGADSASPRRAHLREQTMARQAAERRYARTPLPGGIDGPAMAQERSDTFHTELARINTEHRIWMRQHGIDVAERRTRRPKSAAIVNQAVASPLSAVSA